MKRIADYEGALLSHLNGVYRPGDRALAVELAEAIGFTPVEMPITDTMSLIVAHANAGDPDNVNNVIFLMEMPARQAQLEALMEKKAAADPELRDALDSYREQARSGPDSGPHFGVRCASNKALDAILKRLREDLSAELRSRVTVTEIPPYPLIDGFPDIRQAFVYTDVFATGSTTLGQNIELQVLRDS